MNAWNDFKDSIKDDITDTFNTSPGTFENDGYSLLDTCSESDTWYLAYTYDIGFCTETENSTWIESLLESGGYDALKRYDGFYTFGEYPFNGAANWQTAYYLLYQAALYDLLPFCERVANSSVEL